MKPVSTLVLVADGAHARYFIHRGPGAGIAALPGRDIEEPHAASHELTSDRPGRAQASPGGARSAMEPHHDAHDLAEAGFARRLAEGLPEIMRAAEADRVIVAAPPRLLGTLRRHLPAFAADRLSATLDKDLVKTPAKDLAKHLEDLLAM